MRLLFWRKPKWVDLGQSSFTVGPGKYKATYNIKFDGHNVDKTIVVIPSIDETKPKSGDTT